MASNDKINNNSFGCVTLRFALETLASGLRRVRVLLGLSLFIATTRSSSSSSSNTHSSVPAENTNGRLHRTFQFVAERQHSCKTTV